MNSEPAPISQFAPMSPPALERLVKQCLTRDPDERWQSAGDVRRELEWISVGSSQSAAPGLPARRRRISRGWIGIAAGAAIALLAIAYAFGPGRAREVETPLMRFSLEAPRGTTLAAPAETAISPDGTTLAFVASDSSGTDHVYVRPLANPNARLVPGTENGALPFWSPDGRTLAFFSNGKLRKVVLDGSAPVALCDAEDPRGGAWSPGGAIVFAPNNQGGIVRVSANGGTPTPVTQLDAANGERGHRYPQFLPDGKHFLYVAIGAGDDVTTYAASIDGGAPVEVCKGGSAARWAPPGHVIYLDTGVNSPLRRLVARRFDPKTLRVSGDAELVLDDVKANNFGYANAVANDRGMLVVQHWTAPHARLEWRDRRGAVVGVAMDDVQEPNGVLSPDGKRLALAGPSPGDLFVIDLESGVSTRLTFENKNVTSVLWSPDGKRLVFSRLFPSRGWQIYAKAADGTGPDSLVFHAPGILNYASSWSRDGRWIVAQCADTSGDFDLWKIPMTGDGKSNVYQRTPAQEQGASFSPGRKVRSPTGRTRTGSRRSMCNRSRTRARNTR